MRAYLCGLRFAKRYLDMTPKAQVMKGDIFWTALKVEILVHQDQQQ